MPDSAVTELIVVRHGETVWNVQGRQQGHLDSALSGLGQRQAEFIAQRLADEQFDALYSSDLGRAYHTAEYIARLTGHAIAAEQRLRERHLGIFQGLTMAQVREQYPEVYRAYESHDPDYAIPQGESVRQQYERSVACAQEIAGRHIGQRVAIVTHGGVLGGLFRHALGITPLAPRRYKLYNGSLNTFFVEDGTWMLGTWGDIRHLAGLATLDDW